MSNEFARNMLGEQRKRLVGGLMRYMEERVYPHLSQAEQQALRSKVIASAAAYHDVCLDMLKAVVPPDDGLIANEELLVLVRDMHRLVLEDYGPDPS